MEEWAGTIHYPDPAEVTRTGSRKAASNPRMSQMNVGEVVANDP